MGEQALAHGTGQRRPQRGVDVLQGARALQLPRPVTSGRDLCERRSEPPWVQVTEDQLADVRDQEVLDVVGVAQDKVDTTVWLGSADFFDPVTAPTEGIGDQFLELLQGERSHQLVGRGRPSS